MKKNTLITWILFFIAFFFIVQYFTGKKNEVQPEIAGSPVSISTVKTNYSVGEEVIVKIKNNTAGVINIASNCPNNPFKVLAWTGEKFEEKNANTAIDCTQLPDVILNPGKDVNISYTYWNHSLFGQPGRYKIEAPIEVPAGSSTVYATSEFTVEKSGFWRNLFRTVFYQPIYNTLILFIKIAPARDLGFAIILLTLVIRLILLVPSQRAIVSQRKMQELQPRLEAIKKKYAGNQEKIAQETLQVWKENKVNPFGSCLPIVIQFPILIALFYVIRNGLNPDNSYLLYGSLKDVDLSNIHTNFLGILELTKINTFVLPLLVGVLQFVQMKLTMMKKKKTDEKPASGKGSEMETVNKTMVYMMPVMIALFTISVPAGVGLYWGVSTVFAIGQQLVANKK